MLVSDPCRASADCGLTAVATSASPHAGPTTVRRSPTCPVSVYRLRRSSPCSTKAHLGGDRRRRLGCGPGPAQRGGRLSDGRRRRRRRAAPRRLRDRPQAARPAPVGPCRARRRPQCPRTLDPARREALSRQQASSIGCGTCGTTSAPTTPPTWRSPRCWDAPWSPVTNAWLAHGARRVRSSSSAGAGGQCSRRDASSAPPMTSATPRSAHADTRSSRNAAPSINETTGMR
jgi:hypothetical protein